MKKFSSNFAHSVIYNEGQRKVKTWNNSSLLGGWCSRECIYVRFGSTYVPPGRSLVGYSENPHVHNSPRVWAYFTCTTRGMQKRMLDCVGECISCSGCNDEWSVVRQNDWTLGVWCFFFSRTCPCILRSQVRVVVFWVLNESVICN